MSDKNKIISDIYFDRSGFGSIATTFKDAKAKDKSITLADVKAWFEKNVDRKRPMSGFNSFIAPYAYYEYQIDLSCITNNDLKEQKFRIGLVMIDIFSKFAVVVPIKSKQPPDLLAGIMEGINKMGKKPKMFYSDEEGSLYSKTIIEYLEQEKIEMHRTRGHPAFAERLSAVLKTCCSSELKQMKRKEKLTYNGLITYSKFYLHITTKMFILLLNSHRLKRKSPKMNLKLN